MNCPDPWVLPKKRFLLLTRPVAIVKIQNKVGSRVVRVARSVDADTLETRILASDPTSKRNGNWSSCIVVEILEEWKRQDRKETFWGH